MMMPAADEDDDFIVQTVVERGASDAPEDGALGWGLRKLGGFVFAKTDPSDRSNAVEPEPTLPPGFSATLNAEEEEIYPAETKIKVLVAEGNLGGRGRREAAELHQALQQVVGAAAIYKHLLVKHGVVAAKRTGAGSDGTDGSGGGTICACGGAVGSCKAISALLKEELDKVMKAAETERRGALLKKFRQVERRSAGLCNPDLLEKVVRSSSTDAKTPPKMPPPHEESPRRSSFPSAGGGAPIATAGKNGMTPVSVSGPFVPSGATASTGFPTTSGAHYEGPENSQNIPWADDMLCGATRFRHGAMLKSRGRALAKGLARLLRGVSSDLQGVASRLPPWQEDKVEIDALTQEEPSHGRSQSRSSFTSVDTVDDSSDKFSDAKAQATLAPSIASVSIADGGGDAKARRQDWKLDAQELSLIRREEERVMKPDVLGRLLAAGAGLGCLQQADFWDVFARLEIATRTEALLNIAIRGGRGCPARAGRMGRELCISLTAVVLEAINTVEQAQLHSHSSESQQKPLQLNDPNGQSITQQRPQPQPQRAVTAEKRRPSSERFSRDAIAAESLKVGARARAGSECNGKPQRRGAAGDRRVAAEGAFHKEDPGLKDLDQREEEFRKAIYVNRSALAGRLLQLTHDAPLCAKVLGTFVNDVGNAGQGLENRPWTTGRADASAPFSSPLPQPPGAVATEGTWESLPGVRKGEAEHGNRASNGFDRRDSRKASECQPSPPLSMASTDPLSEGVDDTAAWDQSPPSVEKGGGASAAARSQMASYSQAAPDSHASDALLSPGRASHVTPTGYPLIL